MSALLRKSLVSPVDKIDSQFPVHDEATSGQPVYG